MNLWWPQWKPRPRHCYCHAHHIESPNLQPNWLRQVTPWQFYLSTNCKLHFHCQTLPADSNKQTGLEDEVSQPLTPDVVFIQLPMFGLQTNRSFKAVKIMCQQVWLHPSRLTFTHDMKSIISREREWIQGNAYTNCFSPVMLLRSDVTAGQPLCLQMSCNILMKHDDRSYLSKIHYNAMKEQVSAPVSWNAPWSCRWKHTDLDNVVVPVFSMHGLHSADV